MGRVIKLAGAGSAGPAGLPGSTAGAAALAPNLPSAATPTVLYGLYGNASAFGFSGSVDLPMSDPDFARLKQIHVMWIRGAHVQEVATLLAPWTSTPQAWDSGRDLQFLQDGSSHTDSIEFRCENDDGVITASPLTKSVTVQASAVTGFTSAGEIGTRYVIPEEDRLVHLTIMFVPVLNAGQVPQTVSYGVSDDNGASWTPIGWARFTAVGQQIEFWRLAPGTAGTWKVYAATGALDYSPAKITSLPPGAVASSGFSVAALALPGATVCTVLHVDAGAGGSFPFDAVRPDGSHYFAITGIYFSDAGADANTFFFRVTAQDLDASHNPVGPETAFDGAQVSRTGVTQTMAVLMGDYGTSGTGVARTGPVAYVRLKLYGCNRVDQTTNSFANALCARQQTGIGSGAGYVDVLVASGGAVPVFNDATLPPTGYTPPTTVATIVGAEVGPVSLDLTNQLTHTRIRASGTLSAAVGASVFAVWRSVDNGVTFVGIGVFGLTGSTFSTAAAGDIDTLASTVAQTCKVAVVVGYAGSNIGGVSIPAASLPGNASISAAFTVGAIGAPSATGPTGLSMSAPVFMGLNSIGAPYWRSVLSGRTPGNSDPNLWFLSVTVECVDTSGNSDPGPDANTVPTSGTCTCLGTACTWSSGPLFTRAVLTLGITINGTHVNVTTFTDSKHITLASGAGFGGAFTVSGSERLFGEFVNDGGPLRAITGSSPELLGNYNPAGSAYIRLRLRAYVTNRAATIVPGWQDPSSVMVTTWPGSSDHQDITFGNRPSGTTGVGGTLQGSEIDPNTTSLFIGPDPSNGNKLGLKTSNIGSSILAEWDFEQSPIANWIGTSAQIGTKWGFTYVAGHVAAVVGTGGYQGDRFMRLTGSNTNIYQSVSVPEGVNFYFTCAVRSSNTAGGTSHGMAIGISFVDASGASLLVNGNVTNFIVNTGYQPNWGIGGSLILQAPAGSAKVIVNYGTLSTEPAGGYWDIDSCIVQDVAKMTTNGQTASMVPTVLSSDYAITEGHNPAGDYAHYGLQYMELFCQAGNTKANLTVFAGSSGPATLGLLCGSHYLIINVSSTGISVQVDGSTGHTGAVAGRNAIGGFVV